MPLVSELALMINAIEVVTPVMATCTVPLQVFADTDPVLVVKVVFATITTVPVTVGVAAGKSPEAIDVQLIAASFTLSPVAGAATLQ
jgi:hypothetical protein